MRRVLDGFSDGHWHANVRLFKLILLLVKDVRSDAGDGNVGVLKGEGNFFLIGHVLQLEVSLVAQISGSLDLFEPIVPSACHFTVGKHDLGTDASKRACRDDAERTGRTEDCGVDAAVGVASALVIDMESLELVEALGERRELL